MSTDRKLLRVYCSKPKGAHEVGAVYATDTGPEARITVAVTGRTGTNGSEHTFRPGTGEAASGWEAWCEPCRKRLPVIPDTAVFPYVGKRKAVTLTAEGMWRDPIGVLNRRNAKDR